jgi:hypothetical protein
MVLANVTSVGTADLNGDGIPDLVGGAGTSLSILLGQDGGSFGPPDVINNLAVSQGELVPPQGVVLLGPPIVLQFRKRWPTFI